MLPSTNFSKTQSYGHVRVSENTVVSGQPMVSSSTTSRFLRRFLQRSQMDWEYTFTQMLLLMINPKKVYTFSQYRHRMKKQWARDDPAFLIVLTFFILITSIAYGIAFSATTLGDMMILTFYGLLSLLGSGVVISTACWYTANKYMRVNDPHGSAAQKVEWLYAFDIHCNSFFVMFLLTHVLQYFLLPFLLRKIFVASIVANTLHFFGLILYLYITHLGYRSMSFLSHTQLFLYPIGMLMLLYLLLTILNFNMTRIVLYLYFA
jgi:hypothetical protein